jgi:hypothetical protein
MGDYAAGQSYLAQAIAMARQDQVGRDPLS